MNSMTFVGVILGYGLIFYELNLCFLILLLRVFQSDQSEQVGLGKDQ